MMHLPSVLNLVPPKKQYALVVVIVADEVLRSFATSYGTDATPLARMHVSTSTMPPRMKQMVILPPPMIPKIKTPPSGRIGMGPEDAGDHHYI